VINADAPGRSGTRARVLILSCPLWLTTTAVAGGVLHVDDDAAPGGDGSSWATAHRFLSDALAGAGGGGVTEIRVAQGTYVPDRSEANPGGTGDRAATFALMDGVAVRGGFAGIGAPDPDARDAEAYPSILTGDLSGDDAPGFVNNTENAWHVVTAGPALGPATRLDGFTITAGHADGGGTDDFGGGLYVAPGANPGVIRCDFVENMAGQGGGAFASASDPRVTCCRFLGNVADTGGGMTNFNGSESIVTNCLFAGNAALDNGGAMANILNARPTITNSTIVDNTAGQNGGGTFNTSTGSPRIANAVLWGNSDAGGTDASAQIHVGTGDPIVDYSCVEGGWTGSGGDNLDGDPLFVDRDGPDDDLATVEDNDYRPGPGSPCIDGGRSWSAQVDLTDEDGDGDMTELIPVDLPGFARFADETGTDDHGCGNPVVVDIGAYESAGRAVNPMRVGDTNGDGDVDFADILELFTQWGACSGCCTGDLDGDRSVGVADLLLLLTAWT
jgi:hypothetical protein